MSSPLVSRPLQGLDVRASDGGPLGAALARAWLEGRQGSAAVVRDLLGGFDLGAEAQRTDGGTLRVGQRPIDLASWLDPEDLLDGIFATQDVAGARLKLLKDGDRLDAETVLDHLGRDESFAVAPASRLASALDEGQTLVMDAIDRRDRTLRRFGEHIARLFHSPSNINAYISMRPHLSFGAHWDDHEVLIIQLIGRKRWEVHEPTSLSPHKAVFNQFTVGPTMWAEVIEPGDYLFLPRGWGHTVSGVHELTFHLTVTIPRIVIPELYNGLVHRPPELEAAVTGFAARPDRPVPPLQALAAYVEELAGEPRLSDVVATFRAHLKGCGTQTVSELLGALDDRSDLDDLWIRCPYPGGAVPAVDGAGEVHLAFGGRAASGAAEDLLALAPLTDGRAHHVGSLLTAHGDRMAALVRSGLEVTLFEVVGDPKAWGVVSADRA